MPRKVGRPAGDEANAALSKQLIIDAAIRLIKARGAEAVTVRNVCREADISNGTFYYHFKNKDDLLMYFLRETSFSGFALTTPIEQIAARITELYMHLIKCYMGFGLEFMKRFYSTGNQSLSAYMGEVDGRFEADTVMARSEEEMRLAMAQGIIRPDTDIHSVCMDICTIVKGCVFEWCLTAGAMEIESALSRIVTAYISAYLQL